MDATTKPAVTYLKRGRATVTQVQIGRNVYRYIGRCTKRDAVRAALAESRPHLYQTYNRDGQPVLVTIPE